VSNDGVMSRYRIGTLVEAILSLHHLKSYIASTDKVCVSVGCTEDINRMLGTKQYTLTGDKMNTVIQRMTTRLTQESFYGLFLAPRIHPASSGRACSFTLALDSCPHVLIHVLVPSHPENLSPLSSSRFSSG